MLKFKPKFDLHRDVVSDILRKEASVCRVKGEQTFVTVSFIPSHRLKFLSFFPAVYCYYGVFTACLRFIHVRITHRMT